MIRSRRFLAQFGAVFVLACGAAWFVSRSASGPGLALEPVAPDVLARTETRSVELASVPDASGARAAEVPREAARSAAKYDRPATRPRATYALAGRVVDDRGVACESFVIRADPAGEDVEGRQYATDKFQDTAGAFRLAGVTDGEWSVRATDDLGLVSVPQTVVMPRDARRALDFVLPRPAAISGRVVDGDGKPAASALVEAKQLVDDVEVALRSVTSEADGTFRLTGVPAVSVVLTARRKDRSPALPVELALHPGNELADIVLALRGGGAIEGRLVDGEQRPRFEVEVSIVRQVAPSQSRMMRTDRSGRFRFEDLEPGPFTVTAASSGGAVGSLTAEALVESDRVTFVDLGSGPALPILVRGVVRGDGTGMRADVAFCVAGGGRINADLSGLDRRGPDRTCRASTNQAGEFELRLAAAGTYVVEASVPGIARLTRTVEITDAPEQVVDLALGSGVLAGRVIGPHGVPLPAVTVSAHMSAEDTGILGTTRAEVAAQADGTFRLVGLLPGRYAVVARVQAVRIDAPFGPAVIDGLVLADGEHREGLQLRIDDGCTLRVLVLDSNGNPREGRVLVRGEVWTGMGIRAGTDGIAKYAALPPGELLVTAIAGDECSPAAIRVVAVPGRIVDATIRLVPAGKFALRLVRRDGNPVAEPSAAGVVVRDVHGTVHDLAYVLEQGAPENRHLGYGPLPPGRCTVRARFGDRLAEKQVEVSAGREDFVVLREPD